MRGGPGGAVALVVLALLATGCGGDSDGGGDPAERTSAEPTPSADESADPTTALRERCDYANPGGAELEALTLAGATGGEIEAARIGPATSRSVAILLPQIDGLCGWVPWAAAAEDGGVTSVLVNPCGYGESECDADADADPLNEVASAVDLARTEYGAERVVLLGTSMGGSLTVIAVAAGADVDAWADVSGPAGWDGVELADLAGSLSQDGVVVMAPTDGEQAYDAAEALADAAGVPFVAGRSGHGWDLVADPVDGSVTRIGRRLIGLATAR